MLEEKYKNYRNLLNQAEGSFLKKEFLEAFLIQSCLIEGVLKDYASMKLSSLLSRNRTFKNKYRNYGTARLIDLLFATGNINDKLYGNLVRYWKERNNVIHELLKYDDKEKLDNVLQQAYNLGKGMKGFIVEDMTKEVKEKGVTVAELETQIIELMEQLSELHSLLPEDETKENIKRKIKEIYKL